MSRFKSGDVLYLVKVEIVAVDAAIIRAQGMCYRKAIFEVQVVRLKVGERGKYRRLVVYLEGFQLDDGSQKCNDLSTIQLVCHGDLRT